MKTFNIKEMQKMLGGRCPKCDSPNVETIRHVQPNMSNHGIKTNKCNDCGHEYKIDTYRHGLPIVRE